MTEISQRKGQDSKTMYHEIHEWLDFINIRFITSKQSHREKSTKDFSKPYFDQLFVYGTYINVLVHLVDRPA
jgi:hypothetical protein